MAETARAPFDLTEAESELVAGYQTEYSSMSFALFWLGEYANVLLMCALNAVLFWGGWLPPVDWAPLYYVPGIIWFFGKILVFFFIFSWVKATVPRYRYDQLMRLGWKVFLPISLFWVFLVSGYLMLTRYGDGAQTDTRKVIALYSFDCGPVGWKLDKVGEPTGDRYWIVSKPNGIAMKARIVRVGADSEREEYVQWTDPDGGTISAVISESVGRGSLGPNFVDILASRSSILHGQSVGCRPIEPREIGKAV